MLIFSKAKILFIITIICLSLVNTAHSQPVVNDTGDAMLPQEGNPINTALDNYKNYLTGDPEKDKLWGDIIVSWQFVVNEGAFPKQGFDHEYTQGIATPEMRDAAEKGRRYLGTLDNNSTTTELATLGYTYRTFGDSSHKEAARKTMEWLLISQQNTGGWQQYYPDRGSISYSNHATFNDDAMTRALICLIKAVRHEDPFDSDIFTEDQLQRCETAIAKGVDYILKSQIVMNDVPTVWCAQHNMETYEPEEARSYELPSKSGKESTLVVAFLMALPQTSEVATAVKGAIDWYNNPEVYVADTMYVRPTSKDGASPFVAAPGKKMWYRFYELDTNTGFFCDRNGIPTYDIQDLSEDRYTGYVWAGDWGEPLLEYAAYAMGPLSIEIAQEETVTDAPKSFELVDVYPNPFNPTTNISYKLSEASYVTLHVYDINGRQVAMLQDGMVEAGDHKAVFNASKLASGVYFARMLIQPANDIAIIQTGKMTLMK